MQLYLFQSGLIQTFRHLLIADADDGIPFTVPVPFYLIRHPRGNVLFDTGQSHDCIGQAERLAASAMTVNYLPLMTEEDYIVPQLSKLGLTPTDITHVIVSHLHSDHFGAVHEFPHANCILHARELSSSHSPELQKINWSLLKTDEDYDLFGDGRLVIVSTPGHSPGHLSVLLSLEGWGAVLLAADSIYTREILDGGCLPGVMYDKQATVDTIERIRKMQQSGVRIITGHDPDDWATFKKTLNFYN